MAFSPQHSIKLPDSTIYFFLYDNSNYLGFFSVPHPSTTIRNFFRKIPSLPSKFTLFRNQTEVNMDLSFEELKFLNFEELELVVSGSILENQGSKLQKQKLEMLLCSLLEAIKSSVDAGPNTRIDFKLQTSLKHSNNQGQNFRNSTKPCGIPIKDLEESKLPTKEASNIIQTDNEKKLKTRVYVIEEIIQTEENYLAVLVDLIETVIKPCQELKYLSKDQEKMIFSNIEMIAQFSGMFLKDLKTAFGENFDSRKSLFANTIVKFQPFFKYYNPYYINFNEARITLDSLRKEKPAFDKWLKNIELGKWDMTIDSRLMAPVQRMPRCVILLKELKKNTHTWHPDYQNIDKALKTFEELNATVNKHMEDYVKTIRLFELATKYGKHFDYELIDPRRKFLNEEAMTLINDGEGKQVVCYFLTDMVLIVERTLMGDMKLLKSLRFGLKSYVLNVPNTKHYSHLITIYGEEEGLTFILESEEAKSKIIQFIKGLIQELKKRAQTQNLSLLDPLPQPMDISNEKFVQVKILGTIKRGLEKLSPFIVYFIKIQYGTFISEVFLRYRELKTLDEYFKSKFPEVKISSFPKKKVFHQRTLTIEGRIFEIEKFLILILNSQAVKDHPEQVLKFLSLPPNFYELHNVSAKDNSYFLGLNEVGEKLLRRFSVFRVLFDFFHTKRPIYSLLGQNSEKELKERDIEVELCDGSKHILKINKVTKALDLCYEIAQKVGLISWLDFKLVLEKSEVEDRVIDDDEYVYKALNIDEFLMESQPENPNLLDKVYELLQKGEVLVKGLFRAKYRLKWRKCIFLNSTIENIDYLRDPTKLNYMTEQVFQEIYENRYDLSFNDYCLFGALFAYVSYGNLLEMNMDDFVGFVESKVIFKIIPIKVFIQQKKNNWLNLVLMFWKKLSEELEKIIQFNKMYNEGIEETIMVSMLNPDQKLTENSAKLKYKISDGKILARLLAIKYIMNSDRYGTKTYLAMYRKLKKNEENNLEPKKICKVSVKYNIVQIFDDFSHLIEEIHLKSIEEFNVFPDFVEIVMKSKEKNEMKIEYRLYSSESIHIYRNLELYSQIENLTSELHKKYVKKLKSESLPKHD